MGSAAAESENLVGDGHAAETSRSPLARRIGPIYTIEELARWLVKPGGDPVTATDVRNRVELRQLVGFLTDDGEWALPAWQFDRAVGQLIPRHDVVSLWQRLPHEGIVSDSDLAAWMTTRLESLDGQSPAEWVRRGNDDSALAAAVSRLRARASTP